MLKWYLYLNLNGMLKKKDIYIDHKILYLTGVQS